MASAKQIEANQRNAKKSTGPRTSAGKSRVSLNALKHGLLAQQVVLPNEDESEFATFSQGLEEQLKPAGELEEFFVSLIVASAWRLRRLMRVEKGLFIEYVYQRSADGVSEHKSQQGPFTISVQLNSDGEVVAQERWRAEAAAQVEEAEERATRAEARAAEAEELAKRAGASRIANDVHVGRAFIDDGRSVDAFSRLSRYEAHIQRSMFKAIDQLQLLQATRAAAAGSAPLEFASPNGTESG